MNAKEQIGAGSRSSLSNRANSLRVTSKRPTAIAETPGNAPASGTTVTNSGQSLQSRNTRPAARSSVAAVQLVARSANDAKSNERRNTSHPFSTDGPSVPVLFWPVKRENHEVITANSTFV